jgi:hypothetical protein
VKVERLAEGVWSWTAPGGVSLYLETRDALVLVDPRLPEPDEQERFWRALDHDVERLGLPLLLVFTADETEDAAAFRARYA